MDQDNTAADDAAEKAAKDTKGETNEQGDAKGGKPNTYRVDMGEGLPTPPIKTATDSTDSE